MSNKVRSAENPYRLTFGKIVNDIYTAGVTYLAHEAIITKIVEPSPENAIPQNTALFHIESTQFTDPLAHPIATAMKAVSLYLIGAEQHGRREGSKLNNGFVDGLRAIVTTYGINVLVSHLNAATELSDFSTPDGIFLALAGISIGKSLLAINAHNREAKHARSLGIAFDANDQLRENRRNQPKVDDNKAKTNRSKARELQESSRATAQKTRDAIIAHTEDYLDGQNCIGIDYSVQPGKGLPQLRSSIQPSSDEPIAPVPAFLQNRKK